jgi:hypothetical protein
MPTSTGDRRCFRDGDAGQSRSDVRLEGRLSRIEKHGDQRTGRDDLAQQPEPLCSEHLEQGGDPGDITAGPVVARHQAEMHDVDQLPTSRSACRPSAITGQSCRFARLPSSINPSAM